MGEVTATDDPIAVLGILAEPTRRALYEFVIGRDESVGRDEAAGALGIGRPLAAFHLDRLVAGGLLATEFRRTNGRRGPGAGRPAKLYRRAGTALEVSLPPRRYEWAARVLAAGFEGAGPATRKALVEAARASGRSLAAEQGSGASDQGAAPDGHQRLRETLRAQGFEPREDRAEPTVIHLLNCPFEGVARTHRAVICAMNLALLEGLAEGFPAVTAEPADPATGCCVALRQGRR